MAAVAQRVRRVSEPPSTGDRQGPETGSHQRGHGVARIAFAQRGEVTRLGRLYQRDPQRVLFPRVEGNEPPTAVLVTTSGGLVGGDRLDIAIDVGRSAGALVTTQAAEKVYGSAREVCQVCCELRVEPGGWLEWVPQETILFDRSRLRRATRVHLSPDARFLGGEMLVFGRIARGERLSRGFLQDRWEVRVGGRLVWTDALRLEGDIAVPLSDRAGFDGALACGNLVYSGPDLRQVLEFARSHLPDLEGLRCAATVVSSVLVVRWLGRDPFELRRAYGQFWGALRHRIAGLSPRLPRSWDV